MIQGMPVASGPGASFSVAIANGQSLSGALDMGSFRLGAIHVPAGGVDGTSMTFQASPDGATWSNVYKDDGTEYSVSIAAGRAVVPDLTMFAASRYVKLRTGTSGAATNQTADRTFTVSALA